MYSDLLDNKKDNASETKDQIIEAMRDNIKSKQKLIDDLLDKIRELELTVMRLSEV